MKNLFLTFLTGVAVLATVLTGCTALADVEARLANVTTNNVTITNLNVKTTNIVTVTNVVLISDTYYQTNIRTVTIIVSTNTNVVVKSMTFEPIPTKVWVYVDSGSHSDWTAPELYWWELDGGTGNLTKLSNYNDGYVDWWVFLMDNVDMKKQYGIKMHQGTSWEPIKTENGSLYDRTVTFPILTRAVETAVTNHYAGGISNIISVTNGTYDKLYIYPPGSWYESYVYLMENETNLFKDPFGQPSSWLWDQYLGANYWGSGITFFTFYAPNVRRVWVTGDFTDWQNIPMNLSTGRVFWWAVLSNTSPGDAYKFVIEKYRWTNSHYISDPAAKKNEYTPAMDSAGNRSFIVDHSAYQWGDGLWSRPGYDYYTIYQMHMRTFDTNNPGNWYGWGTFTTATNRLQYIRDLGFTAVEPLPIHEFAGDQSWGYNYTLFYSPESAYCGTSGANINSFKLFVDTAHQKGIAVVIDLVFNHMGASDDIIGAMDPANDWNNPSTYWYSGKTDWGPRFNYANPVVSKFLTDSAKYLLQYYHVDGFRFDATYYIHYNNSGSDGGSFLYNMTRALHAYGSNVFLAAENLPNDSWITGDGGFNFQWNVDMSHELKKLFYDGPSAADMNTMAGLVNWSMSGVNYMTSHDECANGKERTAADLHYARSWGNSQYDAQCQQVTGLATVLMAKGVPMVFMGDESLEGFYDDSYWGPPYNARYFRDWTALSWNNEYGSRTDGYPNRTEAAQTVEAVRGLAWIRRNYDSVHYYDINVNLVDNSGKVLGFSRGGDIYVIINYNKTSYTSYGVTFPASGSWKLIFVHPSGAYGYGGFDGNLVDTVNGSGGNIGLPEYGVLVYKKQ